MVINPTLVKTEALLLYCRDLIDSYKNLSQDTFNIDHESKEYINTCTLELLDVINKIVQPIDYYIRNARVSRIALILKSYKFIDKSITKQLKKGEKFNPSMLCFSLLCSWFAEKDLNHITKEYLFFTIYPYGEIYDKILFNNKNLDYRAVNMSMINLAENTTNRYNNYKFK